MDGGEAEKAGGMWELAQQGGPFLVIMVIASVVILTLALERAFAVVRFRMAVRQVDDRVMSAARRGQLDDARRLCDTLSHPVREVFGDGLDRALGKVKGQASHAMQRESRRVVGDLRSWVWMLGTAGALMPFVGLLGTVLGVMGSFQAMGSAGAGGFGVVSAGIAEALVATAAGLFVALEAMVAFNSLQNAIGRAGSDLNLLVDELVEILTAEVPGAGDPRP